MCCFYRYVPSAFLKASQTPKTNFVPRTFPYVRNSGSEVLKFGEKKKKKKVYPNGSKIKGMSGGGKNTLGITWGTPSLRATVVSGHGMHHC